MKKSQAIGALAFAIQKTQECGFKEIAANPSAKHGYDERVLQLRELKARIAEMDEKEFRQWISEKPETEKAKTLFF